MAHNRSLKQTKLTHQTQRTAVLLTVKTAIKKLYENIRPATYKKTSCSLLSKLFKGCTDFPGVSLNRLCMGTVSSYTSQSGWQRPFLNPHNGFWTSNGHERQQWQKTRQNKLLTCQKLSKENWTWCLQTLKSIFLLRHLFFCAGISLRKFFLSRGFCTACSPTTSPS